MATMILIIITLYTSFKYNITYIYVRNKVYNMQHIGIYYTLIIVFMYIVSQTVIV
jgi:hypothetical protein